LLKFKRSVCEDLQKWQSTGLLQVIYWLLFTNFMLNYHRARSYSKDIVEDSYCSVFWEEINDVVVKDMKEDTLLSMSSFKCYAR